MPSHGNKVWCTDFSSAKLQEGHHDMNRSLIKECLYPHQDNNQTFSDELVLAFFKICLTRAFKIEPIQLVAAEKYLSLTTGLGGK